MIRETLDIHATDLEAQIPTSGEDLDQKIAQDPKMIDTIEKIVIVELIVTKDKDHLHPGEKDRREIIDTEVGDIPVNQDEVYLLILIKFNQTK